MQRNAIIVKLDGTTVIYQDILWKVKKAVSTLPNGAVLFYGENEKVEIINLEGYKWCALSTARLKNDCT